jgi:hypothetical protein
MVFLISRKVDFVVVVVVVVVVGEFSRDELFC